jgi:drug/metabolite transporter (DMT)-like permease
MKSRSAFWPYVGTSLAWGSTFGSYKIIQHSFTPLGIGFGRCLIGAVTLLLVLKRRGGSLPRGKSTWAHLCIVAFLAGVVPGVFVPLAETRVTSVLAGLTAGMIPLTTLLFLVTVFREEKVHAHQYLGLAIGFVGILVVVGVWRGFGANPWWAVLSLLGVIISYGLAFPYIKRYLSPKGINPISLASAQQVVSAGLILPFFLFDGVTKSGLHTAPVLWVLFLGVFAGGFAYMWNFQTVEAWGSSVASTVEYTAALIAVLGGVIFLGEPLAWYEVVGGVIVLLGAAIGWGQLSLKFLSRESE